MRVNFHNSKLAKRFVCEFQMVDRSTSVPIYIGNGIKQLASRMSKLKYFEGIKMMNGMINMDGTMNNMAIDMNTVMYPEITGIVSKMKEGKMNENAMKMDEKMDMNYSNKCILHRNIRLTTQYDSDMDIGFSVNLYY